MLRPTVVALVISVPSSDAANGNCDNPGLRDIKFRDEEARLP